MACPFLIKGENLRHLKVLLKAASRHPQDAESLGKPRSTFIGNVY